MVYYFNIPASPKIKDNCQGQQALTKAILCLPSSILERRIAMTDKIIKITEKQIQDKSAQILRAKQEKMASKLQSTQRGVADDLLIEQMDNAGTIQDSQDKAAVALKESQENAAAALKESQAEDAQILKKANERSAEKLKRKNQAIHCLTGGYSVQSDNED
jgi:hypothetical protein